jgi:hypothetical protein
MKYQLLPNTKYARAVLSSMTEAGTVTQFRSVPLCLREPTNKAFIKIFACTMVTVISLCLSGDCLAGQALSVQQTAKRWEDIAMMRFQAAGHHELHCERTVKGNGFETLGDVFDFCGDQKFLASENYRVAGQHWEKAAKTYQSAGDSAKAREAKENLSKCVSAAKRALNEGVDLHVRATEQYQATNNLDKKISALQKATRNLERLMRPDDQFLTSSSPAVLAD